MHIFTSIKQFSVFLIVFLAIFTPINGKKCKNTEVVVEILQSMKSVLNGLTEEVCNLRKFVNMDCNGTMDKYNGFICSLHNLESNFKDSSTNDDEDTDKNMKNNTTSATDNEIAPGFTPPPVILTPGETKPKECKAPYKSVGGGCYSFHVEASEWKSFGDSTEFCKSQNGILATPDEPSLLRKYLMESNLGTKFWIGARKVKRRDWKWLNGELLNEKEWDENKPSLNGSKRCIYWRHPSFLAVNHYCGEKFAFICEFKTNM